MEVQYRMIQGTASRRGGSFRAKAFQETEEVVNGTVVRSSLTVQFLMNKVMWAVILENEELPKLFLDFLNVRHLPSLPKAESCGSFDETESEESSKLSHQPVLLFLRDPYVLPAASDFPNVVIEGVLHGIFYPHLHPR
ncbi:hypothetical protein H8959_022135 [Pygathrix nigripes]